MKIKELSSNKQVVIANKINEAKFKMTKAEQKLFLYCIGMVDNNPENLESVLEIPILEFAKYLEIDSREVYRDMKSITKRFRSRYVEFEKAEEGFMRVINIVSYIDYYEKDRKIILKVNNDFRPYLIGLKAYFTQYSLQETIQFKSVYSMRLYQILSQWTYKQSVEYSIEKLRFMLDIEHTEYKLYGDFKRKVLEVAYKEINKSSTLRFDYQEIKTGKKITSINFIIKKHTKPKIQLPKTDIKNTPEHQKLEKRATPEVAALPVPNFVFSENSSKEITDEEFIKFVTNPKVYPSKIDLPNVLEVPKKEFSQDKKTSVTFSSISSLSEQFMELDLRLTKLGFSSSKVNQIITEYGLDYLVFVFDKSKIETREKIENKAGYFQSVVNTYKETYKAQNEALEAQKAQSKLNIELETDRKSKIKQKEREFEQEQEVLSREILENDPEIFCKAVYGYMQTFIVDMQFGFTSHPDYNQNRVNNLQSENLKIAKEIRSRFLACQSLRDFINLIKYDEEWLFKAVFYSPEQFDKKNPSYYKSKVSLAKLERVELPFNI